MSEISVLKYACDQKAVCYEIVCTKQWCHWIMNTQNSDVTHLWVLYQVSEYIIPMRMLWTWQQIEVHTITIISLFTGDTLIWCNRLVWIFHLLLGTNITFSQQRCDEETCYLQCCYSTWNLCPLSGVNQSWGRSLRLTPLCYITTPFSGF